MIGKLLSSAVKIATLPITVVESIGDVITGGDGSSESKDHSGIFMGHEVIKGVFKGLEDIDK